MIRAIVGAGGKTSLIKKLASEYREQGRSVFVTTSTHMFVENDTLVTEDANAILQELEAKGYVMAGSSCGEKIRALPIEVYEEVCKYADEVLVEADGSKHMPLKFPNEKEPVIYDNVEEIIVVCGLHGLGKTAKEAVHRIELASKQTGILPEDVIRSTHIQELLRKGYLEPLKEKYQNKTVKIEPNAGEGMYKRALARLIKEEQEVSLIREEWFESQPQLIVCGAGHVSKDLVQMASCLDFKVKVIDDRADFANIERFPTAEEVICDSFDNLNKYLESNAYYVVVTREHKDDFNCVKQILTKPYRYLGMIGSKGKVERTFENLRNAGVSEAEIESIFAPIGLRIHAVTPAEIAVSILAEIIQEKNKKHAASVSRELLQAKEKGVLCIIIEKKGSSPRGVGSMMFVTEEKVYDSIGGGAVEFAAIDDARTCDHIMIKDYYLNSKDAGNLGMICGGSNKVLFIPV